MDDEDIDEDSAAEYCITLGFFVFVIGSTIYIVHIISDLAHNALIPFAITLLCFAFIMICIPPCIGVFDAFLTGNGTYSDGAKNGYVKMYKCLCSC